MGNARLSCRETQGPQGSARRSGVALRPLCSSSPQCRGVNLISEKRHMIIGVPKEIKDHETRVGLVPSGAAALREAGHEVLVETHAGEGSSLTDREYRSEERTSE